MWPSQKTWTLLKWNNVWKRSSWKSWVHKPKLNNSKPNAEYTNKVLLIPLMAKPINLFFLLSLLPFFLVDFFSLVFFCCFFLSSSSAHQVRSRDLYRGDSWIDVVEQFWFFKFRQFDKFFLSFLFFVFSSEHKHSKIVVPH